MWALQAHNLEFPDTLLPLYEEASKAAAQQLQERVDKMMASKFHSGSRILHPSTSSPTVLPIQGLSDPPCPFRNALACGLAPVIQRLLMLLRTNIHAVVVVEREVGDASSKVSWRLQ